MLGNALLRPMVHAQSTKSAKGRALDIRMRMMVVHRLDDGMDSIRVGNAFLISNGTSKVPKGTA